MAKPLLALCVLLGVGGTAGLARPQQDDQPKDPHARQVETLQKLAAVYDLDQKGQLTRGTEITVNNAAARVFHYHGGGGGAFLVYQWAAEQVKNAQLYNARCHQPGVGQIGPIQQTQCYSPQPEIDGKGPVSLEDARKKLAALCPDGKETEKPCMDAIGRLNAALDGVIAGQAAIGCRTPLTYLVYRQVFRPAAGKIKGNTKRGPGK